MKESLFEPDDRAERKWSAGLIQLCYTHPWMVPFLITLRRLGALGGACEAASISRRQAHKFKNTYVEFSEAWDDAMEDMYDGLVIVAHRRARKSDSVLKFLLKGYRSAFFDRRLPPQPTGFIQVNFDGATRDISSVNDLSNEELKEIIDGDMTITGDITPLFDDDAGDKDGDGGRDEVET